MKKILIMNGKKMELSVVEAMEMSEGLINKIVSEQFNGLSRRPDTVYLEREDLEQEVKLQICKAFESYDVSRECAFTTYYYEGIVKHFSNNNRKLKSDKREISGNCFVSLQEEAYEDDGCMLDELNGFQDDKIENVTFIDLLHKILEDMDEDEKKIFLNILSQNKTNRQLAEEFGVKRQTLEYKIKNVYRPKWQKKFLEYRG